MNLFNKKDSVLIIASELWNIGDYALLLQTIEGLTQYCEIKYFTVATWAKPPDEIANELRDKHVRLISLKSFEAVFNTSSLILFPGGQIVRDNSSMSSLVLIFLAVFISKFRGANCAALAIGVSKIKKRNIRLMWSLIFSFQKIITVRDKRSRQVLHSILKNHSKIFEVADLVFFPNKLHLLLKNDLPLMTNTIVIAPCIDPSENRYLDDEFIVWLCTFIVESRHVQRVCFLAHDYRPEMELNWCNKIAEILKNKIGCEISVLSSTKPEFYFDIYRNAALVFTNRLHSAVFSLIANKNVIVLDDGNQKLLGLVEDFKLPLLPQNQYSKEHIENLLTQFETQPELRLYIKNELSKKALLASQSFELLKATLK
jgi:polysaccharide pyruvyl transferase WcaK-like protein